MSGCCWPEDTCSALRQFCKRCQCSCVWTCEVVPSASPSTFLTPRAIRPVIMVPPQLQRIEPVTPRATPEPVVRSAPTFAQRARSRTE